MDIDFYNVGDKFKTNRGDVVTVIDVTDGDFYEIGVMYNNGSIKGLSKTGRNFLSPSRGGDLDLTTKNFHLKEG